MKEIKEILLPARCEALSAISAPSAGHYYLMRIVFLLSRSHRLCRFARRRNKRNKGNLCSDARGLSAISAISAGLKTCRLVGFVLLSQRNKGNEGNLHPTRRSLSALSALSAGQYYLMRIVFLLSRSHRLCRFACRRNEGNKGNASFGCCLRSSFGLKTSGSGTSES